MAIGFAMADYGFDGGSSPQLPFDLAVHATLLTRFEDPAWFWGIVTHIALAHIGALDLTARECLGLFPHLLQCMAVIGEAWQSLGMQDELASLGAAVGRGQGALDAELIGFVCLAFADALGLGRMPGIQLPTPLPLLLTSDLAGLDEGHGESGAERLVTPNLAPDVTDCHYRMNTPQKCRLKIPQS